MTINEELLRPRWREPKDSDVLTSLNVSKPEIAPSAESLYLCVSFLHERDLLWKVPLWTNSLETASDVILYVYTVLYPCVCLAGLGGLEACDLCW